MPLKSAEKTENFSQWPPVATRNPGHKAQDSASSTFGEEDSRVYEAQSNTAVFRLWVAAVQQMPPHYLEARWQALNLLIVLRIS